MFAIPLAGLRDSVFSGFIPTLFVLLGTGALFVGLFAVYQTRRWPRNEAPQQAQTEAAGEPAAPHRMAPVALRPATTSKNLTIAFPEIDAAHPDVWGLDVPLTVTVHLDVAPERTRPVVRLSKHYKNKTEEVGHAALGEDGTARFLVPFQAKGEYDLIAELLVDDKATAQAVRAIRAAEYRDEIVETFEDFVGWASSHYAFADRRMTAREFVDRYADGRPGTPLAPLERIVDLYELANYSEHPVDRNAYLELVDAFLELEQAGALEGPGEA